MTLFHVRRTNLGEKTFILRKTQFLRATKFRVNSTLNTVYVITFGSGKQLFPGLTATGINSVRGAL